MELLLGKYDRGVEITGINKFQEEAFLLDLVLFKKLSDLPYF